MVPNQCQFRACGQTGDRAGRAGPAQSRCEIYGGLAHTSDVALSTAVLVVTLAVSLLAGTVTGMVGFGFAVVGTMALATVLAPAEAVAFMLLPIVGANLALIAGLKRAELSSCIRRFWPYILAALVGTMVGMVLLGWLPEAPLRVGLGVLTLAFVATRQRAVPVPGLSTARDRCFAETPLAMAGLGGVSGLLFGGTNVGVQIVAYVKSCDLSHGVFAGVIGLIFVGINGLRVVAAVPLGLYPDFLFVGASALAVLPALAGVALGRRLRMRVPEHRSRQFVLALLTGIAILLLRSGLA